MINLFGLTIRNRRQECDNQAELNLLRRETLLAVEVIIHLRKQLQASLLEQQIRDMERAKFQPPSIFEEFSEADKRFFTSDMFPGWLKLQEQLKEILSEEADT